MAKNKKYVEEVVNEPEVSETPSVLVALAPEDKPDQLSPNPAHSGFVKQLFVDSLPESGEPNVLYCVAQKSGVEQAIVGYKNWKWDLEEKKFVRVYGSDPLLKLFEGQHGVLKEENNPPSVAPEKIFVGEVVFIHEPTIEGKKLHEFIDLEGGVTQQELVAALGNYYKKNETYNKTQTDNLLGEKQDLLSGATTPEGTANKLVGLDSNGNLVQSPLPEGTVVVDEDLDENSTNPVENKAVAAKFNEVDESLEQKANVDGNYPTLTAGNADQLNSTVYVVDKVPYLYRTSGGDADIGNREYDKIIGGSLAVNQLVQNGNFESTSGWSQGEGTTISASNNELSITITTLGAQYYSNRIQRSIPKVPFGHKVLMFADVLSPKNGEMSLCFRQDTTFRYVSNGQFNTNANSWTQVRKCLDLNLEGADYVNNIALCLYATSTEALEVNDIVKVKNVFVIDLTQMFGSTIADYIYSLEQANAGAGVAWFRNYFKEQYYPYNNGAIKNVKLVSHDMIGFNQWDEEWLNGYYDANGEFVADARSICSKNKIRVIPNATYFCKVIGRGVCWYDANENFIGYQWWYGNNTIVVPANACFMNFNEDASYGTVYKHDICINLSWSGWRNGQYEKYQKNSYPLDATIELRGIPKLDSNNHLYFDGDEYSSDGKVVRKYGIVDLGTLTWSYDSTNNYFYAVVSGMKDNSYTSNDMMSPLYTVAGVTISEMPNMSMRYAGYSSAILIKNNSYSDAATFKAAMSGVYLVYELATPTEENANAFQEPQIVDDFGTEEYVVPTQDGWQIPVGHDTKYPANLRDKLQRLPDMPSVSQNVTETYVVNYNGTTKKCTFVDIASWLGTNGWIKLTDITGYDATKTQTLKNVNGTLTWVDDE